LKERERGGSGERKGGERERGGEVKLREEWEVEKEKEEIFGREEGGSLL
jgi:hypothetical protein